jgi:glycosyltransferase involved in cell wall biosynthesis
MKLSILICTIPEREIMFNHLKEELERQVAELGLENHIEILSDNTAKGEMFVGEKRNVLKALASGEYICFMDDDDYPSLTYLRRIFEVIHKDVDIITIDMNYFVNGKFKKKYVINRWQGEIEMPDKYIIDRIFYHLCPHKKLISDKVLFSKKNFQEDADYSYEIKPLLKTEFHIDEPIYNYYFDEQDSATRN